MLDASKLTQYLDGYLKIKTITDWPDAFNGLQIANEGKARKIGAAIDGCEYTIRAAVEKGIDYLIVHHGLHWGGAQTLTGANYRRTKLALNHGLAVYSAHLPLD